LTIREALCQASETLAAHSTTDAHLEAEILLMHVLGIDRARLYASLGQELSHSDVEVLTQLVNRRVSKEPVAYITGHREFFGYDFHVAPGVLIPRPESELLVEETLDFVSGRFPRGDPAIADIGTGSGAIAVSLALRLPNARVFAIDISRRALDIAGVNCAKHGVEERVHLLEGDLLSPLAESVDVIVANLPYVTNAELGGLGDEIQMHEPSEALAGGADGLDEVRRLLRGAGDRLRPQGAVVLEIGPAQAETAASLAGSALPQATVELRKDLGGWERVLRIRS